MDDGAGSTLEFGGADMPNAVSRCSATMVGEVASSSSSTTRTTTVAAEDEYSESSIDGVRHQLAFCVGLESNLKSLVKPSSRRSSSGQSSVILLQDRRQASWATNEFLVAKFQMRLTSTKILCI